MSAIDVADRGDANEFNLFYIAACEGTGIAYLYNAILNNIRVKGNNTIAIAWTGMASIINLWNNCIQDISFAVFADKVCT